jgi:class 3 adenylate cyclase
MASSRRLAAILAADVAGYSRLMRADEEGRRERLNAVCRQLVDPKIEEHQGRIDAPGGGHSPRPRCYRKLRPDTPDTAPAVAASRVDPISCGWITHSALSSIYGSMSEADTAAGSLAAS